MDEITVKDILNSRVPTAGNMMKSRVYCQIDEALGPRLALGIDSYAVLEPGAASHWMTSLHDCRLGWLLIELREEQ